MLSLINFQRMGYLFADARARNLLAFGLHSGQALEGTSAQHQQPERCQAVVRRPSVRTLGHQARRPLRHQQFARLRDAGRRHESGLRNGRRTKVR